MAKPKLKRVTRKRREKKLTDALNEMANETYDWIELRLMSDTMEMPAGNYIINDSYAILVFFI